MTDLQTVEEVLAVATDCRRLVKLKRKLTPAERALVYRQSDYLRELADRLPRAVLTEERQREDSQP